MVTMRIYTDVLSEEITGAGKILRDKLSLDLTIKNSVINLPGLVLIF